MNTDKRDFRKRMRRAGRMPARRAAVGESPPCVIPSEVEGSPRAAEKIFQIIFRFFFVALDIFPESIL